MVITSQHTIGRRARRASLRHLALAILLSTTVPLHAWGKGFDVSRWTEERLRFSGSELIFKAPARTSKVAPPLPTIRWTDLNRDLGSARKWRTVYGHTWDYEGRF